MQRKLLNNSKAHIHFFLKMATFIDTKINFNSNTTVSKDILVSMGPRMKTIAN
jgi:hypothetical protein